MKSRYTITSRIIGLVLLIVLTANVTAQKVTGVKKVTDYSSIVKLSGTQNGVNLDYKNPYTNANMSTYAGTIKGTLNSTTEYFYCIDIRQYLVYNENYWDEGSTPSEITYILNNYFPHVASTPSGSDNNIEAAAVQYAIWHFSDGNDANTITNNNSVKNRALTIIADAVAHHNNVVPLESLVFVPTTQSLVEGTTASFDVYAFDASGAPVSNTQITLSSTLGSLNLITGTTNALGHLGPITLTHSGIGTATITARANVVIPQGTRYVHSANPNGQQKLVLATPGFDVKTVTASVTWYAAPPTGTCDTHGFTTYTQGGWGSPSNSGPGKIRDLNFTTVFPNGLIIGGTNKLTLTTATAVKNFLPQGGTSAAFSQSYVDVTSTSAGVLASQLVCLKMNVAYDAAGKLGTNSGMLGDLAIANGPFTGMLVKDFLSLAENAIGGGSLNGFTFSQINGAATAINENFDEGEKDLGFLTCATQHADLKIEKSSSKVNPVCDENITYTIKVTNLSANAASNVVVNDVLPAGLIYQSCSPAGVYNAGTWTVGSLAGHAEATLTITVKVDCGSTTGSSIDLGAAKGFNLFVLENLTQPSSDTEGKVAVGNDANLGGYSIADKLPATNDVVFVVGHDLNYESGMVYGSVVYGNATNLPKQAVTITGTLTQGHPIDFVTAASYLTGLSNSLSGQSANCTTTFQWGGLMLKGTDPYLNVFNVNGSDLNTANDFQIDVPNGSVVLVNINGTSISWGGGLTVKGTTINNVLFNFYQATNLSIKGIDVRGSILAPKAALDFPSGVVNGQVIVKSMSGSGQFNNSLFVGNIPVNRVITNTATVTSTNDDVPANNSASATITVGGSTSSGNPDNGTGSGNSGSGNTGSSWTNVCSFSEGQIVYTLLYDGVTDIYAGTMGGKIFKSTDKGLSWKLSNSGMNVNFIWSFVKNGNTIYAGTEKGVYSYNGTTWVPTSLSGKDVHALTVRTEGNTSTVFAGTWGYGIFKLGSNDTWTECNTGLEYNVVIQSLTVKGTTILAGTVGGGLYKSTDGASWSKASCGYEIVWSMASSSAAIYAGTYGDGLHKSTDGGLTFTKLANSPVSFIYNVMTDAAGNVYVSSLTNGVFESTDGGANWTALGMGGYSVSALMVNPKTNDIYAGTKEGTVYKMSGSKNATAIETEEGIPTEFKLAQNYPNPFNPTTTIEFSIPAAGSYALKVYDVLGQEVATLINKEMNAGYHKVTFDASRIATGMYIYRLVGNNVNLTKKMLLVK